MDSILQWITTPPEGVSMLFWGCALIGALLFIIQTIMSFIGMEMNADVDVDFDGGDTPDVEGRIPFFSIHSLVNFVMGFGWTGVILAKDIPNKVILNLIAVIVGVILAYGYIFLRKKMMSLESNGAYNINDCVGKTADVYLRIPAEGQGRGKIQVSIHGSIHEFDAISAGEDIPTGDKVTVLSADGTVLTVRKC